MCRVSINEANSFFAFSMLILTKSETEIISAYPVGLFRWLMFFEKERNYFSWPRWSLSLTDVHKEGKKLFQLTPEVFIADWCSSRSKEIISANPVRLFPAPLFDKKLFQLTPLVFIADWCSSRSKEIILADPGSLFR